MPSLTLSSEATTPGARRPGPARARLALLTGAALVLAAVLLVRTWSPGVHTPEERTARDVVVGMASQAAMAEYTHDMDDVARAAVGSGATVIDVYHQRPFLGGTLGHLTFLVTVDDPMVGEKFFDWFGLWPDQWDPGPYCFRVAFDEHGKVGEPGTPDGAALVDCPADAAPVTLPPDDTPPVTPPPSGDPVAAPEARDAAHEVLVTLPAGDAPDADDVAARINEALPAAHDGRPVAQATVFVDDADVGVAMGDADDCVLVARIGGEVRDVYPPPVYLQPGELGCTGSTALSDLRPPH